MRPLGVILVILALGQVLGAARAAADAEAVATDFAELDAALTLADVGLADERPDMILSAAEVIAELAPRGAADWTEAMLAEVRLLARGDPDLLQRAAHIRVQPETNRLWLAALTGGSATLHLSPGLRLGLVRTPTGWNLDRAVSGTAATCDLSRTRVTDCGPVDMTGQLTVEVISGPDTGILALQATPAASEGGG